VLWFFFGCGVDDDDDALALGGHSFVILVVILAWYGLSCFYSDW